MSLNSLPDELLLQIMQQVFDRSYRDEYQHLTCINRKIGNVARESLYMEHFCNLNFQDHVGPSNANLLKNYDVETLAETSNISLLSRTFKENPQTGKMVRLLHLQLCSDSSRSAPQVSIPFGLDTLKLDKVNTCSEQYNDTFYVVSKAISTRRFTFVITYDSPQSMDVPIAMLLFKALTSMPLIENLVLEFRFAKVRVPDLLVILSQMKNLELLHYESIASSPFILPQPSLRLQPQAMKQLEITVDEHILTWLQSLAFFPQLARLELHSLNVDMKAVVTAVHGSLGAALAPVRHSLTALELKYSSDFFRVHGDDEEDDESGEPNPEHLRAAFEIPVEFWALGNMTALKRLSIYGSGVSGTNDSDDVRQSMMPENLTALDLACPWPIKEPVAAALLKAIMYNQNINRVQLDLDILDQGLLLTRRDQEMSGIRSLCATFKETMDSSNSNLTRKSTALLRVIGI